MRYYPMAFNLVDHKCLALTAVWYSPEFMGHNHTILFVGDIMESEIWMGEMVDVSLKWFDFWTV